MGHILFITFLNNLGNNAPKVNTIPFADDTNTFLTGTKLSSLELWFKINYFTQNEQKPQFMVVLRRQNRNPIDRDVSLRGNDSSCVSSVKAVDL